MQLLAAGKTLWGEEPASSDHSTTSPSSAFRKRVVFLPVKAERGRKVMVLTGRWTSKKKKKKEVP